MELGNMVFGNSRGEHSVPRGAGFEEELSRLFDSYAPDRDSSWREYGVAFENDVFRVFPYYWGDCDCGSDCPKHKPDCDVVTKWGAWVDDRLRYSCGKPNKAGFANVNMNKMAEYDKKFPAPKCSCGEEEKWEPKEECLQTCSTRIPNFHYKPTNFRLDWYKYPLRDSYSNQKIGLKEFKKMIDACISSLPPRGNGK